MNSYRLRLWGDPVLTQPAAEVTDINGSLAALVDGMLETMYDEDGLGIAAPQVGVQKRLFTYQMDPDTDPITVINPTIAETDGEWEYEEGCLSLPGLYFTIARPKRILMTGWDVDGNELAIEADELEARCLQHELDHLDGVLMLSLLDKGQRKKAMRELRRMQEG